MLVFRFAERLTPSNSKRASAGSLSIPKTGQGGRERSDNLRPARSLRAKADPCSSVADSWANLGVVRGGLVLHRFHQLDPVAKRIIDIEPVVPFDRLAPQEGHFP